jgi:hypothetical protein
MPGIALRSPRPIRWLGGRLIFISYRRNDCADVTGRIHDRLVQRFGGRRVIMDVASIPLGEDFRDYIGNVIPRCSALLSIIGPRWLDGPAADGAPPLVDPLDMVRLELDCALESNVRVIPVLVGGARMPAPQMLPDRLSALAYRHGMEVRGDLDFHRDVDRLIADL